MTTLQYKLILAGLIFIFMVWPAYSHEVTKPQPPYEAPSCGISSALNLAGYLGKLQSADIVSDLSNAYPQAELSLFDVQQAAKQIGVKLDGVKASLAELEKRQQPFIAVLPNHFVFVERVEEQWVRYIEDEGIVVQSRTDFESSYQGKALVLSAEIASNTLHISPAIVAWGKIPIGSLEKKAVVTLTNTGQMPINIKNISTSCSCTIPSEWPRQIAPGQNVPLEITVELPPAGEFIQTVAISSDAAFPNQSILLSGHVESDVQFSPSQLNFGEITIGETITKSLTLKDNDHKMPRPLQASVASSHFTSELKPKTDENIWEVTVTLRAPLQPGAINTEVSISGTEAGSRVIQIPIKAHIVPMTRARPDQAIFGSVSSDIATRTLQIFRQDNQPFEITGIQTPDYLSCEFEPTNRIRNKWQLRIKLLTGQAPAQVNERLLVSTKYGETTEQLRIPVLALVENRSPTERTAADASKLPRAEDLPGTKIGLPLPKTEAGEVASDFRAVDSAGNPWKLSAFRGNRNVILTFFPQCFTSGCTTQLISLRDYQQEFDAAQIQVLAVSTDPPEGKEGQQAFAREWHLGFPLLSDVERQISLLFGAVQNKDERAARMSILIDKSGIVRWIDTDVNVSTHGADVLAKMRELGMMQ